VGIYERDYYRQGRSGFELRAPRTAIGFIILVNIAVFVIQNVDGMSSGNVAHSKFADFLSVHLYLEPAHQDAVVLQPPSWWQEDTLRHPWLWWQFLTYGFVHSSEVQHILFNMLALFFLGRDVERHYGTREFVRFYLATMVIASLVWSVANHLFPPAFPSEAIWGVKIIKPIYSPMCGASGAIAGVVLLFALNFPRQTLLIMFIPMPAWLAGGLLVGLDIWGAMGRSDEHIAYACHLGGAAFALAYYQLHWNFGQLFHWAGRLKFRSRPPLKVFQPQDDSQATVDDADVDRILEKINREGMKSLTRREQNIMANASRRAQQRRRGLE
jgi:membrane associated rhomboid family serine protease